MLPAKLIPMLFITLIIIVTTPLTLLAQTGSIHGIIRDGSTGEPLPGANVMIQGTNIGAATSLQGEFHIQRAPVGSHRLTVSYIGYERIDDVEVTVRQGEVVQVEFDMRWIGVTLDIVTISAQARGQISAINQQLASRTITNIVSADRIRELPDVNAAESIGRLPGVSIHRSGGEANMVSIRGLSPKYNLISVNGVRVPSTGGHDRSVDLSMISSNMLEGIEVMKAAMPDQDADVLGGTVDLKLREAPEGLRLSVSAQGGYNDFQNYYGNYNITANVSDRFFDNRLGVIANFNIDEYDRSADKFSGNYREWREPVTQLPGSIVRELTLREESVIRGRTGASLLLDYRIPDGKITGNTFYNRLHNEAVFIINRMNINDNRHYFDTEERGGTTSMFTGSVAMEKDLGWVSFDAGVSRTSARTKNPDEKLWNFVRENNAFEFDEAVTPTTHPTQIPATATMDSVLTIFEGAYIVNTEREENQTATQLNIEIPFNIGTRINGFVKTGAKFRWLDRFNDVERTGRGSLQYGNNPINTTLALVDQVLPDWEIDHFARQYSGLPIQLFLTDYKRDNFLDGEYPLGFVVDREMLRRFTEAILEVDQSLRYSIPSLGNDYDGIERYQAGYVMAEFNIGQYVTFIPGIRWEGDYSKYTGLRYREVTRNNIEQPPADLDTLKIKRTNDFWLPMVHLRINPYSWMNVRLARTETLTRPDFMQYAPITSINVFQSYIRASNSLLRPAHSTNYDAAVSVHQNHVGLFTIAGFYKEIEDLIFQIGYQFRRGVPVLPGLNIPPQWLDGASPEHDTYMNNPHMAYYRGFELDWQTNFWYMPGLLKGIVVNVNYTRIYSETRRQIFSVVQGDPVPGTRPPVYNYEVVETSRSARMPDQPAHIFNLSFGYDYKGFSGRISYLYQTDVVRWIARNEEYDEFSDDYARWDLSLKQRVGRGIELFANFNNINNRADRSFRGAESNHPTYIEYYGFTMDLGFRFTL